MSNKEMQEMIEQLKSKVEDLEKKRVRKVSSADAQTYTISARIQLKDVDKMLVPGDKIKFLPPQAKYSLKAIIGLRDAASGVCTFSRKDWGDATELEVTPWWKEDGGPYKQDGVRVNNWYHHQHTEFCFTDMQFDGEPLFS